MKEMYKGQVNSPQTRITRTISAADTDIPIEDGNKLPLGPNLAIIGTEENAETIKYESINENILIGCTRGFQGIAKTWEQGTIIARNITEYDLYALQENVNALQENKIEKEEGKSLISDEDQKKIDTIPENPKYSDTIYDDSGVKKEIESLGISKQDKLISGENIQIIENVISAIDTIYDDADIIEEIKKLQISKIEKEEGKSLISDVEKEKLNGIEVGAQKNAVTSVQGRTGAVTITKTDIGLGNVENIKLMVLTEAEYNALSDTEKNRGDVWYGVTK